jgi:hypothetical protein
VWTILVEDRAAPSDMRVVGENGVTSNSWVDWSAAPVDVWSQCRLGFPEEELASNEIVLEVGRWGGGRCQERGA